MDANNESKHMQGQVGGNQHDDVPAVAPRAGVGNKSGGSVSHVPAGQLPSSRAPISVADDRRADPGAPAHGTDGGQTPLAQMHALIQRAGEEPFGEGIISRLSIPIDDSVVDIRPDGLIYVSHPHYRNRLDAAFGVGGWALVPLDKPQVSDNRVYYRGFLKAHGRYIAEAHGEAPYFANNAQGSYGNSVESAKSDCLVRCCKWLPMFRECWDREYAAYWVATYAHEVAMPGTKSGKGWKKKGAAMRNFDTRPERASVGEYSRPSRLIDEHTDHLKAIAHEGHGLRDVTSGPAEDHIIYSKGWEEKPLSSQDEYEDMGDVNAGGE